MRWVVKGVVEVQDKDLTPQTGKKVILINKIQSHHFSSIYFKLL